VSPGSRQHRFLLIACFVTVYLVWGSTFMGMKLAVQELPPLFVGGARFGLAGLLLLALLACLGRIEPGWLLAWRYWRTAIVTGVLMLLLANGLLCASLKRDVPTGIAALIVGSTPISMVTMDRLQTRRGLPSGRVMLGMALGLLGVVTLVGSAAISEARHERIDAVGAVMVLASTLFWSGGSIVGRTMPQPREPLLGSALQMMVGGATLLAASAFLESWSQIPQVSLTSRAWLAWLYLAIFGSLVSFTAYMWLIRNASAAAVATYAYVNPLVAMGIGWFMLDERLHWRTAAATLLILGGVILMQWRGRSQPRHDHEAS
jgi:drug/metabolite transporter (DMT)-like permease